MRRIGISLVIAAMCIFAGSGNAQGLKTFRDCSDCPEMVAIPPGNFVMGSPATEEGRGTGETQHKVTIGYSFAVGKYSVTFDEWDACVSDGGCNGYRPDDQGWGRGRRPVINVSLDDSNAYIAWLSKKTGKQYRLLSEAEWEYAGRAGTQTVYFWGDMASHERANYGNDMCCSGFASGKDAWVNTGPVGSFPPNAFGLYDMSGNSWQWVADCWNDDYTGAPADGSASLTGNCMQRVHRGGSWYGSLRDFRSAMRGRGAANARQMYGGFRLARAM